MPEFVVPAPRFGRCPQNAGSPPVEPALLPRTAVTPGGEPVSSDGQPHWARCPVDEQLHFKCRTGELTQFTAAANHLDTGASCTLLVIHRVDGWAFHGLGLPGQGLFVASEPVTLLAQMILDRTEAHG